MLEIALIYVLSKSISSKVKSKGYKPVWFVLMFIAFWFAGEILGLFAGVIIGIIFFGPQQQPPLIVYLFGLIGAALGATTAFLIVNFLPVAQPKEEEDELEEEDDYAPAPAARLPLKDEGQYFDPQTRRPPPRGESEGDQA